MVKLPTGAARLQLDPDRISGLRNRIDRHGLWVGYSRVLGVSSHKVRGDLEKVDALHLCRAADCGGGEGLHCKCSAVVDAEGLVDLGAHGGFTPWRCLVLLWRTCSRTLRWASRCCLGSLWAARRRRASGGLGRQIQDEGELRALDPDSQSEAEFIPDGCKAVRVGLELQGRPRALASEGCQDKAAPEPTRLMVRDQELSDLGGKEVASLCNHHSQLYMLSCQGRKCSVFACFNEIKGSHRGTPFCKKHLSDAARSPSPSSARTPQVDSASLSSVLRSQFSQPAKPDTPRGRSVSFPEEPAAAPPVSTSRRRSATPPPPPAEAEESTEQERQAHGLVPQLVLVRLHPFFGSRGDSRQWYLFAGNIVGVAPDSRRQERSKVEIPSLGIHVSVPWASTVPPPALGAGGRLPRDWILQFLHERPSHLEEQGIGVQVVRLPGELGDWARDWDGRAGQWSLTDKKRR